MSQNSPAYQDGIEAADDQLDDNGMGFIEQPGHTNADGKFIPFWQSNPQEFKDFWAGYHSVMKEESEEVAEINLATVTAFFEKFPHLSKRVD